MNELRFVTPFVGIFTFFYYCPPHKQCRILFTESVTCTNSDIVREIFPARIHFFSKKRNSLANLIFWVNEFLGEKCYKKKSLDWIYKKLKNHTIKWTVKNWANILVQCRGFTLWRTHTENTKWPSKYLKKNYSHSSHLHSAHYLFILTKNPTRFISKIYK